MRLLETIRVENGEYKNLHFHKWRIDWSRKKLAFKNMMRFELPKPPKIGVFRCRIIYLNMVEKVEFIPYTQSISQTFSFAFDTNLDYSLKYENRNEIAKIKSKFLNKSDDIIFVKDSLIQDSSIANIALFDGNRWITPKTPLLQGTTRERLLQNGKIFESDIYFRDIDKFQNLALMNSMLNFKVIKSPKYFGS